LRSEFDKGFINGRGKTERFSEMIRKKGDGLVIRIRRVMIRMAREGIRHSHDAGNTTNMLELKNIFKKEQMPSCLSTGKILC